MVLPGRVPRYESSDVQLLPRSTTKQSLGVVPGGDNCELNVTCGLFNLYQVVERTPAIRCCDETDDRPLLGLSAQQHYHQQEFQPLCRR